MACSSSSRELEIGLLQVWGWGGQLDPKRRKQCSYLHLQTTLECLLFLQKKSRLSRISRILFSKGVHAIKEERQEIKLQCLLTLFLDPFRWCIFICHSVTACAFHLTHLSHSKYWIPRQTCSLTFDEHVPSPLYKLVWDCELSTVCVVSCWTMWLAATWAKMTPCMNRKTQAKLLTLLGEASPSLTPQPASITPTWEKILWKNQLYYLTPTGSPPSEQPPGFWLHLTDLKK